MKRYFGAHLITEKAEQNVLIKAGIYKDIASLETWYKSLLFGKIVATKRSEMRSGPQGSPIIQVSKGLLQKGWTTGFALACMPSTG